MNSNLFPDLKKLKESLIKDGVKLTLFTLERVYYDYLTPFEPMFKNFSPFDDKFEEAKYKHSLKGFHYYIHIQAENLPQGDLNSLTYLTTKLFDLDLVSLETRSSISAIKSGEFTTNDETYQSELFDLL